MKKIIALLLALVMVLSLAACGGNTETPATEAPKADTPAATEAPAGPEAITLKVWAPQEDQVNESSWLIQIQKAFEEAHPEYAITWDNGVCPEGDAATMVTADPAAAADVYMYANDQLGTLLQAGALAKLGGSYLEQVQTDVSATYVNTVTSTDGGVYGFPVAPNTWFMYYNKALVGDADLTSLESVLEKGIVAFEVKNSWYLPSFFFAAGGTLFGETGADAAAGIKFGGEAGYAATNAVLDLLENPNFKVDGDGYGNLEVGVSQQVQNSVGSLNASLAAELNASSSVSTGLAEQGAASCEEEGRQVPGVLDLHSNNALLQNSFQRGQVSVADDSLVVVHEPGVGSYGEAVDVAVGGSDGVLIGSGDVSLDLLQVGAAQLSQSASLDQSAQLVISEHVNVSSSCGVSSDHGSSVALGANAVVPSDSVLGVSSFELLLNLDQPGVLVNLIFLGSPDLQGDCLRTSLSSGSLGLSAASSQTQNHNQSQQHGNDLLHCVSS